MSECAKTPWGYWLLAATTKFGLDPDHFWALSLTEWALLNDTAAQQSGGDRDLPSRDHLQALLTDYPDISHD